MQVAIVDSSRHHWVYPSGALIDRLAFVNR
jgi:hypothetical protein